MLLVFVSASLTADGAPRVTCPHRVTVAADSRRQLLFDLHQGRRQLPFDLRDGRRQLPFDLRVESERRKHAELDMQRTDVQSH